MASAARLPVTVLLGDPRLADSTKRTGTFAEEDRVTLEKLRQALESLPRFEVRYLDRHDTLLADLQRERPSFVLNLCDTGYQNRPTLEPHVAALLELLGIPYSGAGPAALVTCFDKGLVSALAGAMGIPVPREQYFETPRAARMDAGLLPALIKPSHADGSVGITRHAVVRSVAEAAAYLAWLDETFPGRGVLVQEFLEGTEYSVGLIGNPAQALRAYPLVEADFSALPADCAPILCFESKAEPASPYWGGIAYREARAAPAVAARMVEQSKRLFARLEMRDYARIDFRADAQGTVKLLEVNPNPAWAYDSKMTLMAGYAGHGYSQLLEAVIDAALARLGSGSAAPARPA